MELNDNIYINQIGGKSPFDKMNLNTAGYIFTRDIDGTFYFGFVRKLARGGRIRLNKTGNNGAAGTKEIYWGKWTSIGGGKKKYRDGTYPSHLRAVISELNDETGKKNLFKSELVDLSKISSYRKPKNFNIIAHRMEIKNNTAIFIFEILNSSLFFSIYPKRGITHPNLLTTSMGEIDAIQSYTTQQIIDLQNSPNNKNNYFISYCIQNFIDIVMNCMCDYSKSFKNRWTNKPILKIHQDTTDRIPWELLHAPYREFKPRLYIWSDR